MWNAPPWLRAAQADLGVMLSVEGGVPEELGVYEKDMMRCVEVAVEVQGGGEAVLDALAEAQRVEAQRVEPKATRVWFTDVITRAEGDGRWRARGVCLR